MELEKVKEEYDKLSKKYKLPDFVKLNEDFDLWKIDKDSLTILRTIRKLMMQKIYDAISFFEMLLNPVNAPRIYLYYIKTMTNNDKQKIEKIYNSLKENVFISLMRDVEYSEKGEAELILKIFNSWNEQKKDFLFILQKISKPDKNLPEKNKTYFG